MSDWYMGQLAEEGRPLAAAAFPPPAPAWPDPEQTFQQGIRATPWFSEYVKKYGEEPDLNTPDYNYRTAWAAGARPEVRDPTDENALHWPSEYKGASHPNRYVDGVDTLSGQSAHEAAAAKVAAQYRNVANRAGTSNMEAVAEALVPQEPWEYGLAVALPGAGLAGRAFAQLPKLAKMGALAAGFGATASEAEGAPLRSIWQASWPFDLSKPKPEEYHRIGARKQDRPLDDIPVEYGGGKFPTTPTVPPSWLEGKILTPLTGDATMRGKTIKSIDDINLSTPLLTQGGHGYIRDTGGYANVGGAATGIGNRVKELQRQYDTDQILGVYTKMGPQSGDFSHHTWGGLSRMMPEAPMTKAGKAKLDELIQTEIDNIPRTPKMIEKGQHYDWKKWPGVGKKDLEGFIAAQPDAYRKAYINATEKARGAIEGVPDVVAVRKAITDPKLLYEPTGASGLSMGRLTGEVVPGPHTDFPRHIVGDNPIGLGRSVPGEVMYPDMVSWLDRKGLEPPRWQRNFMLPPAQGPRAQRATPQWVDDTSQYLENVDRMGQVAAFDKYIFDRFGWR